MTREVPGNPPNTSAIFEKLVCKDDEVLRLEAAIAALPESASQEDVLALRQTRLTALEELSALYDAMVAAKRLAEAEGLCPFPALPLSLQRKMQTNKKRTVGTFQVCCMV